MKKFLVIILACVFTFPLFGCSGQTSDGFNEDKENYEELLEIVRQEEIEFEDKDEIVFTAEKPICNNQSYELGVTQCKDMRCLGIEDIYEKFSAYYRENIKERFDGSFYFTTATSEDCPPLPEKKVCFYYQGINDDKYVNPYISEYITINEDKFENSTPIPEDEIPITGLGGTISLSLTFIPVHITKAECKFRMEFGEYSGYYTDNGIPSLGIEGGDLIYYHKTYINIYRGEDCIATCYYKLLKNNPKEQVTYEWFADFFKRNLRLMV